MQSKNNMTQGLLVEMRSKSIKSPPTERISSLDSGRPPTMIFTSRGKVTRQSSNNNVFDVENNNNVKWRPHSENLSHLLSNKSNGSDKHMNGNLNSSRHNSIVVSSTSRESSGSHLRRPAPSPPVSQSASPTVGGTSLVSSRASALSSSLQFLNKRHSVESDIMSASTPPPLIPAPKSFLERQSSLSSSTTSLSSTTRRSQKSTPPPPPPPLPVLVNQEFSSDLSLPTPPSETSIDKEVNFQASDDNDIEVQLLSSLKSPKKTRAPEPPATSPPATSPPATSPSSHSPSPPPLPPPPLSLPPLSPSRSVPASSSSSASSASSSPLTRFQFPPPPSSPPPPLDHPQTTSSFTNTSVSSSAFLSPHPRKDEDKKRPMSPTAVMDYFDETIGVQTFSTSTFNDAMGYTEFSPAFHFPSVSDDTLPQPFSPVPTANNQADETAKEKEIKENISSPDYSTSENIDHIHPAELSPKTEEERKKKGNVNLRNVAVLKLRSDAKTVRQYIKPGTVDVLANLFANMTDEHVTSPANRGEFDFNIQETAEKLESLDKSKEDKSPVSRSRERSALLNSSSFSPRLPSSVSAESLHGRPKSDYSLSKINQSPRLYSTTSASSVFTPPAQPDHETTPGFDFLSASREIHKHVILIRSNSRSGFQGNSKADVVKNRSEKALDSIPQSGNLVMDGINSTPRDSQTMNNELENEKAYIDDMSLENTNTLTSISQSSNQGDSFKLYSNLEEEEPTNIALESQLFSAAPSTVVTHGSSEKNSSLEDDRKSEYINSYSETMDLKIETNVAAPDTTSSSSSSSRSGSFKTNNKSDDVDVEFSPGALHKDLTYTATATTTSPRSSQSSLSGSPQRKRSSEDGSDKASLKSVSTSSASTPTSSRRNSQADLTIESRELEKVNNDEYKSILDEVLVSSNLPGSSNINDKSQEESNYFNRAEETELTTAVTTSSPSSSHSSSRAGSLKRSSISEEITSYHLTTKSSSGSSLNTPANSRNSSRVGSPTGKSKLEHSEALNVALQSALVATTQDTAISSNIGTPSDSLRRDSNTESVVDEFQNMALEDDVTFSAQLPTSSRSSSRASSVKLNIKLADDVNDPENAISHAVINIVPSSSRSSSRSSSGSSSRSSSRSGSYKGKHKSESVENDSHETDLVSPPSSSATILARSSEGNSKRISILDVVNKFLQNTAGDTDSTSETPAAVSPTSSRRNNQAASLVANYDLDELNNDSDVNIKITLPSSGKSSVSSRSSSSNSSKTASLKRDRESDHETEVYSENTDAVLFVAIDATGVPDSKNTSRANSMKRNSHSDEEEPDSFTADLQNALTSMSTATTVSISSSRRSDWANSLDNNRIDDDLANDTVVFKDATSSPSSRESSRADSPVRDNTSDQENTYVNVTSAEKTLGSNVTATSTPTSSRSSSRVGSLKLTNKTDDLKIDTDTLAQENAFETTVNTSNKSSRRSSQTSRTKRGSDSSSSSSKSSPNNSRHSSRSGSFKRRNSSDNNIKDVYYNVVLENATTSPVEASTHSKSTDEESASLQNTARYTATLTANTNDITICQDAAAASLIVIATHDHDESVQTQVTPSLTHASMEEGNYFNINDNEVHSKSFPNTDDVDRNNSATLLTTAGEEVFGSIFGARANMTESASLQEQFHLAGTGVINGDEVEVSRIKSDDTLDTISDGIYTNLHSQLHVTNDTDTVLSLAALEDSGSTLKDNLFQPFTATVSEAVSQSEEENNAVIDAQSSFFKEETMSQVSMCSQFDSDVEIVNMVLDNDDFPESTSEDSDSSSSHKKVYSWTIADTESEDHVSKTTERKNSDSWQKLRGALDSFSGNNFAMIHDEKVNSAVEITPTTNEAASVTTAHDVTSSRSSSSSENDSSDVEDKDGSSSRGFKLGDELGIMNNIEKEKAAFPNEADITVQLSENLHNQQEKNFETGLFTEAGFISHEHEETERKEEEYESIAILHNVKDTETVSGPAISLELETPKDMFSFLEDAELMTTSFRGGEELIEKSDTTNQSKDFLSVLDNINIETDITSNFLRRSPRLSGTYSRRASWDVKSDPDHANVNTNEKLAAKIASKDSVVEANVSNTILMANNHQSFDEIIPGRIERDDHVIKFNVDTESRNNYVNVSLNQSIGELKTETLEGRELVTEYNLENTSREVSLNGNLSQTFVEPTIEVVESKDFMTALNSHQKSKDSLLSSDIIVDKIDEFALMIPSARSDEDDLVIDLNMETDCTIPSISEAAPVEELTDKAIEEKDHLLDFYKNKEPGNVGVSASLHQSNEGVTIDDADIDVIVEGKTKHGFSEDNFYQLMGEIETERIEREVNSELKQSLLDGDRESFHQSFAKLGAEDNNIEDNIIVLNEEKESKEHYVNVTTSDILHPLVGEMNTDTVEVQLDHKDDKTFIEAYVGDIIHHSMDKLSTGEIERTDLVLDLSADNEPSQAHVHENFHSVIVEMNTQAMERNNNIHDFSVDNNVHDVSVDNSVHNFSMDNSVHNFSADNKVHDVSVDKLHAFGVDNSVHVASVYNNVHDFSVGNNVHDFSVGNNVHDFSVDNKFNATDINAGVSLVAAEVSTGEKVEDDLTSTINVDNQESDSSNAILEDSVHHSFSQLETIKDEALLSGSHLETESKEHNIDFDIDDLKIGVDDHVDFQRDFNVSIEPTNVYVNDSFYQSVDDLITPAIDKEDLDLDLHVDNETRDGDTLEENFHQNFANLITEQSKIEDHIPSLNEETESNEYYVNITTSDSHRSLVGELNRETLEGEGLQLGHKNDKTFIEAYVGDIIHHSMDKLSAGEIERTDLVLNVSADNEPREEHVHDNFHSITVEMNTQAMERNNNVLDFSVDNNVHDFRVDNNVHAFSVDNNVHDFSVDNNVHAFSVDNEVHDLSVDNNVHNFRVDHNVHDFSVDNEVHDLSVDNNVHAFSVDNKVHDFSVDNNVHDFSVDNNVHAFSADNNVHAFSADNNVHAFSVDTKFNTTDINDRDYHVAAEVSSERVEDDFTSSINVDNQESHLNKALLEASVHHLFGQLESEKIMHEALLSGSHLGSKSKEQNIDLDTDDLNVCVDADIDLNVSTEQKNHYANDSFYQSVDELKIEAIDTEQLEMDLHVGKESRDVRVNDNFHHLLHQVNIESPEDSMSDFNVQDESKVARIADSTLDPTIDELHDSVDNLSHDGRKGEDVSALNLEKEVTEFHVKDVHLENFHKPIEPISAAVDNEVHHSFSEATVVDSRRRSFGENWTEESKREDQTIFEQNLQTEVTESKNNLTLADRLYQSFGDKDTKLNENEDLDLSFSVDTAISPNEALTAQHNEAEIEDLNAEIRKQHQILSPKLSEEASYEKSLNLDLDSTRSHSSSVSSTHINRVDEHRNTIKETTFNSEFFTNSLKENKGQSPTRRDSLNFVNENTDLEYVQKTHIEFHHSSHSNKDVELNKDMEIHSASTSSSRSSLSSRKSSLKDHHSSTTGETVFNDQFFSSENFIETRKQSPSPVNSMFVPADSFQAFVKQKNEDSENEKNEHSSVNEDSFLTPIYAKTVDVSFSGIDKEGFDEIAEKENEDYRKNNYILNDQAADVSQGSNADFKAVIPVGIVKASSTTSQDNESAIQKENESHLFSKDKFQALRSVFEKQQENSFDQAKSIRGKRNSFKFGAESLSPTLPVHESNEAEKWELHSRIRHFANQESTETSSTLDSDQSTSQIYKLPSNRSEANISVEKMDERVVMSSESGSESDKDAQSEQVQQKKKIKRSLSYNLQTGKLKHGSTASSVRSTSSKGSVKNTEIFDEMENESIPVLERFHPRGDIFSQSGVKGFAHWNTDASTNNSERENELYQTVKKSSISSDISAASLQDISKHNTAESQVISGNLRSEKIQLHQIGVEDNLDAISYKSSSSLDSRRSSQGSSLGIEDHSFFEKTDTSSLPSANYQDLIHAKSVYSRENSNVKSDKSSVKSQSSRKSSFDAKDNWTLPTAHRFGLPENDHHHIMTKTTESLTNELKTDFSKQSTSFPSDNEIGVKRMSTSASDNEAELIGAFLRSSESETGGFTLFRSAISREISYENLENSVKSHLSKESIDQTDQKGSFSGKQSDSSSSDSNDSRKLDFSRQSSSSHSEIAAQSFLQRNSPATYPDQSRSDTHHVAEPRDFHARQEVDKTLINTYTSTQDIVKGSRNKETYQNVNGHTLHDTSPASFDSHPHEKTRADLHVDNSQLEVGNVREIIETFSYTQDSHTQRPPHSTSYSADSSNHSTTIKNRYSYDGGYGDRLDSSLGRDNTGKHVTTNRRGLDSSPIFTSLLNRDSEQVQPETYSAVKNDRDRRSLSPASYHEYTTLRSSDLNRDSPVPVYREVIHHTENSLTGKTPRSEPLFTGTNAENSYNTSTVLTHLNTSHQDVFRSHPTIARVVDTVYDTYSSRELSPTTTTNNQPLSATVNRNHHHPEEDQFPITPVTITTPSQAVVGDRVGLHIDFSPTGNSHLQDALDTSSDDDSNQKRYVIKNVPQKSLLKRSSKYNSLEDSSPDLVFTTQEKVTADLNRTHPTISASGSLSPRTVVDGPVYRVSQSPKPDYSRSLSSDASVISHRREDINYSRPDTSFNLGRDHESGNLYTVRSLSTSVPDLLNYTENQRGRSRTRSPKNSDSEKIYKVVRRKPHSPERFFKNPTLSLRKEDIDNNGYSSDQVDSKQYRTVTKVYLNGNQPSSRPQSPDTRYRVSSLQSQASIEKNSGEAVEKSNKVYEVLSVKSSNNTRDNSLELSDNDSDSGFQGHKQRYRIIGTSDSSLDKHRVQAQSSPKLDRKLEKEATRTRVESVQPSRLSNNAPSTHTHRTVIQLEVDANTFQQNNTHDVLDTRYMIKRIKSADDLLRESTSAVTENSQRSGDRKMWRTGRSRSNDTYNDDAESDLEGQKDDLSSRFVSTTTQKDTSKRYVVNNTVSYPLENHENTTIPSGRYRSTIDINYHNPHTIQQRDQSTLLNSHEKSLSQFQRLNNKRSDDHRAENKVPRRKREFTSQDSGQGADFAASDGENEFRHRQEHADRIYEARTESLLPEHFRSLEDLSNDLRVLRGKILIKNRLDSSEHLEDGFDENANLFDTSFHLGKDNPLYSSDPDIRASLRKEDEQEIAKHVHQDITFETVDRIAHGYTADRQVQQSPGPQRKKQNLSSLLLSKLANVDSKDIRQTVHVEHHNEEINGDINFVHADGEKKESKNTYNFDSVNEKVELTLTQGKAHVIIKVIAERIVPADYEFNIWRKSQAIVTRQIEIDLLANEQRKRLYQHVMSSAATSGSLEGGSRSAHYDSGHSSDERQLSSMETLKLFTQILDVTDGQGDRDHTGTHVQQEEGQLPASVMDILY